MRGRNVPGYISVRVTACIALCFPPAGSGSASYTDLDLYTHVLVFAFRHTYIHRNSLYADILTQRCPNRQDRSLSPHPMSFWFLDCYSHLFGKVTIRAQLVRCPFESQFSPLHGCFCAVRVVRYVFNHADHNSGCQRGRTPSVQLRPARRRPRDDRARSYTPLPRRCPKFASRSE